MANKSYGDGWGADKLHRKEEAKFLTKYLIGKKKLEHSNLDNGSFVLNVNADWGHGKTYFLCNWADDLAAKGHPVVYFDAWQNDFSKEPLIAFISAINNQLEPCFNRSKNAKAMLGEWVENGKKILLPSAPLLLGVLAKKLTGMSLDQLDEYLEEDVEVVDHGEKSQEESDKDEEIEQTVSTLVSKAASKMLTSHNTTKKTIAEFKSSLGKLTRHLEGLGSVETPIFIFVDELDRCRPDYAIELLEKIKHLFGVPGVVFVVATASDQLCHSIRKVYGQGFDSPNYLKRFFDQTYTLQVPNRHSFAEYLFDHYGLSDRENLFSPLDESMFKGKNIRVEAFAYMSDALGLGLRDMIQYCVIIDSISLTFNKSPIHLMYIIFLARLLDKNKEIYDDFVAGNPIEQKLMRTLSSNLNNTVETYVGSSSQHRKPGSVTALEIINEYIGFINMDSRLLAECAYNDDSGASIFQSIAMALYKELPKEMQAGKKAKNHLSLYPKLLEQAGRIT